MEAKSNSSFASSNNTNKDNKVRCIIGSNKEDKWIRISRWCINTSNNRLIRCFIVSFYLFYLMLICNFQKIKILKI